MLVSQFRKIVPKLKEKNLKAMNKANLSPALHNIKLQKKNTSYIYQESHQLESFCSYANLPFDFRNSSSSSCNMRSFLLTSINWARSTSVENFASLMSFPI